jgi:SHS2 domain-containing protein
MGVAPSAAVGRWDIIEEAAIADCALAVEGTDLDDLFATAARALADLMVDPATLSLTLERTITLEAPEPDLLLHDWLAELIFLKDRDAAVFPDAEVRVTGDGPFALRARVRGGTIDRVRTELRADAKAVTFHQLGVERAPGGGWRARVVIDI